MKNIIFYFSGTGNSLYLAKKIAYDLENTELVRISEKTNFTDDEFNKFKDIESIGIVSPVYALGLPVIVRQFIKNFFSRLKSKNFCENKYIFVVVNYGGISGQSFSQIEKIFEKISAPLHLIFGLKMPDNYIPAYNTPSEVQIQKILKNSDDKIKNLVKLIKNKKTSFERNFLLLFPLILLAKFFYNSFVGFLRKHNFAKDFWIDEKCNGCGVCEKVCPVLNIVLDDSKKPVWSDKCEFCLACISWCPQKSIQYKKSTLNKTRYNNPNISLTEIIMDNK
jgi:ferredoxin